MRIAKIMLRLVVVVFSTKYTQNLKKNVFIEIVFLNLKFVFMGWFRWWCKFSFRNENLFSLFFLNLATSIQNHKKNAQTKNHLFVYYGHFEENFSHFFNFVNLRLKEEVLSLNLPYLFSRINNELFLIIKNFLFESMNF